MKKQPVSTVTVVLAAISLIMASSAFGADKETEAVRAAADEFYLALNFMFTGELGQMKRIWSHEDDVTYMGPDGGYRIGWKQVLADWENQAALKLGGKVEPKDLHITVGSDLAFVSNYEIGKNVTADGESKNVTIRATNLFRKEDGNWKMIGHHTDILSFLQK